MKLHYYADTDSLYIDLNDKPSVESREVVPGVIADFDEAGNLVGLDLTSLETESFPAGKLKIA